MKITGGHLPKIAGRPLSTVEEISPPDKLYISLNRCGVNYKPVVKSGQKINFGATLAVASITGGKLSLPSPASGKVLIDEGEDKVPHRLIIETAEKDITTGTYDKLQPERVTSQTVRNTLAKSGVWPFFWSSLTDGTPTLDENEKPRAIIINTVLAEPFRTRGKVVLRREWKQVVQGIKFLPRLLADYGTVEIILTARRDPVARMMYMDLAGFARLHFHPVPLLYPVENPKILSHALRKSDSSFKKDDVIWEIDIQGMVAIGACLSEGLPLHRRILALGGPGISDPKHVSVRIGTPFKHLLPQNYSSEDVLILRGGLLKGEPIIPDTDSVGYDDDSLFFLPEMKKRKLINFMRPGFNRTSSLPCFASQLTGASDSEISTSLRGERRPCIACGICERVCPAGLMPQVIHRYLYREAIDEAEAVGLDLCIFCGLCTYVCPSKVELQKQFMESLEQLRLEHEEAAASVS